ncbi:phosphatidylserine decarboxylase, variant 4 [Aphanomyces invadans]|uniref:phosphatidylserine decarboxylase n=1 Tax=Aphanomyces invadans TaxID=157072 RepID=A0A024TNB5_9STRA|nr:phosphatidylserine decarboxylase, variant 3 [Aphanomyces invadans]XP_008875672.1 phosphatidylserine decarboxylase, variant 4 [Aphanomyces invadans]ETV95478.1 phosphatidylserine decarboxylase, variant 3 [Aphanomyces invadans]ETV95479.1 phosphatidylserine decarboxylase, variant 4 [Aphanomyces invadans]|eukprot:XP_008875671.1 phosphatidylserine decarboxylase, variant 3 [Aphanomyces invadans]
MAMLQRPASRVLKRLGLRFKTSYAAKKNVANVAPKMKPTAPWFGLVVGSAVGAYGGYEVWKTWNDEKNPAHVYDRLPGGKTAEEDNMGSDAKMFLLHLAPYRAISRAWGAVNSIELPVWMREPIYMAWTRAFDCKLDEMKYPLEHYKNLGEFFSRPLKDGIRPINWDPRCVSSPVDGTMASFGVVDFTDDIPVMDQIKGVRYRMDDFLGEVPDFFTNPSAGKRLFHCVIYLAPGDYHRIHSPIDWSMGERRHFPGDLFPVNSRAVHFVPSLFTWNERVALLGRWKHGFFSMSLVGATNVGSMTLDVEPNFATNKWKDFYLTKEWGSSDVKKYERQELVTRGDQVAQFKVLLPFHTMMKMMNTSHLL